MSGAGESVAASESVAAMGPAAVRAGTVPAPARVQWAEALGLAVLLPLAGVWLQPGDPFLLHGGFCWPVLGVVAVALRHGQAPGLGCALALGLGLGVAQRLGLQQGVSSPLGTCVGLGLAGLVAGEFRAAWARRLAQARLHAEQQRVQLERLGRACHLLRLSHSRLEQQLAHGAPSLQELVATLRTRLAPSGGAPLRAGAEALLGLLESHCGVQAAAVHAVGAEGRLECTPVASLGAVPAPVAEDCLVREALRTRQVVSVRSFAGSGSGSALLAAVPLVDGQQRPWGVVAVAEMEFASFNEDTLRLLALLGAEVGEALGREAAGPVPEQEVDLRGRQAVGLSAGGV